METEYIQCVGADLRRIFSGLLLGLPNQNEGQNSKAWRGANPYPEFWGSENVEKSVRDHGGVARASQFGA